MVNGQWPIWMLDHEDVSTTMLATPVMRQGVASVRSPLDLLSEVRGDAIQAALAATRRRGGAPIP